MIVEVVEVEGDKVDIGDVDGMLRSGTGFAGSALLHLETRLLNDDVVRVDECGD